MLLLKNCWTPFFTSKQSLKYWSKFKLDTRYMKVQLNNTHTYRRFGPDSVDASLMELDNILSRWNGIVDIIADLCDFCCEKRNLCALNWCGMVDVNCNNNLPLKQRRISSLESRWCSFTYFNAFSQCLFHGKQLCNIWFISPSTSLALFWVLKWWNFYFFYFLNSIFILLSCNICIHHEKKMKNKNTRDLTMKW